MQILRANGDDNFVGVFGADDNGVGVCGGDDNVDNGGAHPIVPAIEKTNQRPLLIQAAVETFNCRFKNNIIHILIVIIIILITMAMIIIITYLMLFFKNSQE